MTSTEDSNSSESSSDVTSVIYKLAEAGASLGAIAVTLYTPAPVRSPPEPLPKVTGRQGQRKHLSRGFCGVEGLHVQVCSLCCFAESYRFCETSVYANLQSDVVVRRWNVSRCGILIQCYDLYVLCVL